MPIIVTNCIILEDFTDENDHVFADGEEVIKALVNGATAGTSSANSIKTVRVYSLSNGRLNSCTVDKLLLDNESDGEL